MATAAAERPLLPGADFYPDAVARIEVETRTPFDALRLQTLGFDIVSERPHVWTRILAWPGDAEALERAGFRFRILEADFGRAEALAKGALPDRTRLKPLSGGTQVTAVPPEGSGSLGGFYAPAEIEALMDSLAAFDAAGIVSDVVTIGTTVQGRPIRALGFFRESPPDTNRPRVLFTALTHAREPEGMQVLARFMRDLVSNYNVDPNLTYLVNNREIWVVPVVNPDGYQYNYNTWFTTGSFGLWRKNLRDNNGSGTITSADGVDLNRNFGFQWGFDNVGSSPTASSQTYRGPSGFSEPETRALRDFCNLKRFSTAQNFHTYAEVCLYPWGYNATLPPDSTFYVRVVDDMLREPVYAYGFAADLLYLVNGDANDWMYGDVVQKPRVLAVTTEVGTQNDNFWPPASRIAPLAAAQQRSNVVLSYAAGCYVRAIDAQIVSDDGFWHPGLTAGVRLTLQNNGLLASSANGLMVTASTTTPGVTVEDATSPFPTLPPGASGAPVGDDLFVLRSSAALPPGTLVPVLLDITDDTGYALRDTVTVIVGQPTTVLFDDCRNLSRWTATGGWGIQTAVAGADTVFSDSPAGNYAANADARLTLTGVLDLSGGSRAYLSFRTTWDIEGGYDFGQVEISTNGGTSWTPLAGRLTRPGHGTTGNYAGGRQTLNAPGYDMTKRIEDGELIDLSAYAGLTNVKLRFRLLADSGLQRKGWFVDDIAVRVYGLDVAAVPDGEGPRPGAGLALTPAWPNPFRQATRLDATFGRSAVYRAAVFGVDGRLVRILSEGMTAAGTRDFVWDGTDGDGRPAPSGHYYLRVDSDQGSATSRVVRIR